MTLFTHRRYARECAVMALYIAESSGLSIEGALLQTFEFFSSEDFQEEVFRDLEPEERPVGNEEVYAIFERFSRMLAEGVWEEKADLDEGISSTIPTYDYARLATVDRNVLRVALWELWHVPYVPPAVTLNEAVEIVKKYSTAESSRFVNGVLGTLLKRSPKASWSPKDAVSDPDLPQLEQVFHPKLPSIEVEVVEEGTEEAKEVQRFGVWRLRAGDDEIPPRTD